MANRNSHIFAKCFFLDLLLRYYVQMGKIKFSMGKIKFSMLKRFVFAKLKQINCHCENRILPSLEWMVPPLTHTRVLHIDSCLCISPLSSPCQHGNEQDFYLFIWEGMGTCLMVLCTCVLCLPPPHTHTHSMHTPVIKV